jgi:invasion protein IalB
MVDRGITLDAGTQKPIVIPFQLCTPTGCQAVANLAPDFIDALGKAQKASATVFPIGSKPVQLTLSVKGLPDALAALKTP